MLLCLTSPDPALLQFVKLHVNKLEMDVDKMAFDLEQERQAVKKSVNDVSTRIEKLELRVTKLEGSQTSALHLETANTGMKQRRFYICFCFIIIIINYFLKYLKTRAFYEPLPPKVQNIEM